MGRISSAVETPHRRPTQRGGEYSPERRYHRRNRTYSRSRSRSPLHNSSNRYRRASPDYSYPNLDEPRKPNERKNIDYDARKKSSYLDRDSRNVRNVESESDEELKGLPYEDYRRLKRQKLRKMLTNNFWNCTPSPPRGPNEKSDGELQEEDVGGDGEKQLKDGNKLKNREESESDSDSDSDDYRSKKKKRRKGRKSGSRRKSKRSKSVSESESESEDEGSGEERRRKSRKSRSRRKSRRSKSISESENEESGEDDSGEDRRSRKSRSKSTKRSSKRKRSGKKKSGSGTGDSDNSDHVASKKQNHRSSSKSKKKKETSSGSMSADERAPDLDVDAKDVQKLDEDKIDDESNIEFLKYKEMIEQQRKKSTLDDEPPVGPMPLPKAEGHISYGGALRPGEGDAIAQFVQQGKRIPRRGEVGLSADEISRFEDLGYVMSGSRHQRMNAIRIRKENQVYSAEDKRALAMFNYEEKAKREQKVMADLQRLVQRHIGEDTGPSHDPFGGGKAAEEAED